MINYSEQASKILSDTAWNQYKTNIWQDKNYEQNQEIKQIQSQPYGGNFDFDYVSNRSEFEAKLPSQQKTQNLLLEMNELQALQLYADSDFYLQLVQRKNQCLKQINFFLWKLHCILGQILIIVQNTVYTDEVQEKKIFQLKQLNQIVNILIFSSSLVKDQIKQNLIRIYKQKICQKTEAQEIYNFFNELLVQKKYDQEKKLQTACRVQPLNQQHFQKPFLATQTQTQNPTLPKQIQNIIQKSQLSKKICPYSIFQHNGSFFYAVPYPFSRFDIAQPSEIDGLSFSQRKKVFQNNEQTKKLAKNLKIVKKDKQKKQSKQKNPKKSSKMQFNQIQLRLFQENISQIQEENRRRMQTNKKILFQYQNKKKRQKQKQNKILELCKTQNIKKDSIVTQNHIFQTKKITKWSPTEQNKLVAAYIQSSYAAQCSNILYQRHGPNVKWSLQSIQTRIMYIVQKVLRKFSTLSSQNQHIIKFNKNKHLILGYSQGDLRYEIWKNIVQIYSYLLNISIERKRLISQKIIQVNRQCLQISQQPIMIS